MFTGLSAFPLTPLDNGAIDEQAFIRIVQRLVDAEVDSITALGSTGSYAYLTREERARVARLAVERAGAVPVIVGVGAMRTEHVLQLVDDAQRAGASGVMLAPVSYQALTPDDVFGLYERVSGELSVPLLVYDNPGTTHFTFTDELYSAIAALPQIGSIKIPGVPIDPDAASRRIAQLRELLPSRVSIGVSGDAVAATGLIAGCDAWYSVIAGTLPLPPLAITRAVQTGNPKGAAAESARLEPLWALFARHGSLRVTAAIAEQLGLAHRSSLPLPIRGLSDEHRREVAAVITALELS